MDVWTKRSTLLVLNQTDFSSFRLLKATIHHHLSLDFFAIADPSVDWNSKCLDILGWNHIEGIIIWTIMISLWNIHLSSPLLIYCLKSLIENIRIYISTNPLNRWCYFLSRRWYLAWCTKINHLILNLPCWLLHTLHWWSRIILHWFSSSTLNLLRWILNCLGIITLI